MKKFLIFLSALILICDALYAVDILTLHINDTMPYYYATIWDSNGPYDLSGCTVLTYLKDSTGHLVINGSPASVTNATSGEIQYQWANSDTNTVGAYTIQFKITNGTGKVFTVPTGPYAKIIIEQ
jgi:hypothetical protein